MRELDASGGAVTFEIVAKSAGVSRSWLYTQPDIRAEIDRLRSLHHRAPTQPVPARQCTTDPSLLQRLEIVNARNRELAEDNQQLRQQLAQAPGELGAAGRTRFAADWRRLDQRAATAVRLAVTDPHCDARPMISSVAFALLVGALPL